MCISFGFIFGILFFFPIFLTENTRGKPWRNFEHGLQNCDFHAQNTNQLDRIHFSLWMLFIYLFFVTGMLKEVAELFGRWALHDSVPRRPWPASRAPFRFSFVLFFSPSIFFSEQLSFLIGRVFLVVVVAFFGFPISFSRRFFFVVVVVVRPTPADVFVSFATSRKQKNGNAGKENERRIRPPRNGNHIQ